MTIVITMVMYCDSLGETMLKISKSKLKSNMLEIFRKIESSGEELIVTHHNKPVLRIIPIRKGETIDSVFGDFQGHVVYHADIDEPTIDEWGDV